MRRAYDPRVSSEANSELDLRRSVRRLQDIVDNSAALVYVKDTDGRYLLVNQHFEREFGLSRQQVLGRTDFELFPEDAATGYTSNDRRVRETGRAIEVEELAHGEEGRYLSIKFPMTDESGRLYGVGGISTDITDRKRAEAAAQKAKEEAERANRAKSEFLSRMSHELRTPLNAILGFAQLLQLDDLPGESAASVDRILRAGRHLLVLINEVLEITRLEAPGQHVSVEPVHACEPLQEALELVRPLALEHDVELLVDLHRGLYEFVLADYQRLKQVLLNVLTNAIKYNRRGGIVRVSFRRSDGGLRYRIIDTGPGIQPQDLERLFVPFERLGATSSQIEGTGLGLALSRSLVEAMGGRIDVEHTAPSEGSTFYVELPLAEPPADPSTLTFDRSALTLLDGCDLGRATVLSIEDNLSNFDLVQGILRRVGEIDLIPAMQGQLGLELAARHQPDVILLDLHLPDIAGDEVLRRLRADSRTREIPVVVLSADAIPTQVERLRGAGIVDYVTKPIEIERFLGAMRLALGRP
jgi:PAS domain S-box-containing protein